jgi:hypothetical protein
MKPQIWIQLNRTGLCIMRALLALPLHTVWSSQPACTSFQTHHPLQHTVGWTAWMTIFLLFLSIMTILLLINRLAPKGRAWSMHKISQTISNAIQEC